MIKRSNFIKRFKKDSLSSLEKGHLKRGRIIVAFLFSVCFAAFFTACSDEGTVGGGLSGAETNVQYDTLEVAGLRVDTLISYTGNLIFFSTGRFQDPLFGDITAVGLFKPFLASNDDTLRFDNNTQVILNLTVVPDTVYGDTLSAQQFGLYEAEELWRANQWRIRDNIQTGAAPIATFSVGDDDTAQVPLPDEWVDEYGKFFNSFNDNRDSVFVRQFFGLVLRPEGSDKIVTVNPFNTTFLATNIDVIDTDSVATDTTRLDSLSFGLREWAFSVERSNVNPSPQSSLKLISTFERVIRFDYDFDFENIETRNIAKVELIFYVDKLLLEQSINQAGAAAVRPVSETLNLYYLEGDELPQSLSSNPTVGQADYNEEDEAYRFNITQPVLNGFFEATSDERVFYLTIGDHQGIIQSGLIFNSLIEGKAPKVVVTYVETEN